MNPSRERDSEPPWLKIARTEFAVGVREVKGPGANPRILAYFAATKLTPLAGDETSWCSAFCCWCVEQSKLRSPRRANARSWLEWGVTLEAPQMGAVVVLSRGEDPTFGHVGFWIGESRERLLLLSGNQADSVSVAAYQKTRLLGYRWPAGYPRIPLAA